MTPPRSAGSRAWFWAALVLHALIGWPYLVSGLVVPPVALAALMAVWIVLLLVLLRRQHAGPAALVFPAVAIAVWFLLLWVGDALLGWTA